MYALVEMFSLFLWFSADSPVICRSMFLKRSLLLLNMRLVFIFHLYFVYLFIFISKRDPNYSLQKIYLFLSI